MPLVSPISQPLGATIWWSSWHCPGLGRSFGAWSGLGLTAPELRPVAAPKIDLKLVEVAAAALPLAALASKVPSDRVADIATIVLTRPRATAELTRAFTMDQFMSGSSMA